MSGYRPRPYRILNRTPRMVASAFRAVFSHSECDVCFVMIFIAHLSKNFLKFFEKTCQECVSEDIYRVKGIRVWVVAQATRHRPRRRTCQKPGPGRPPAAIPARDGMKISLRCRSLSHRQRRGCFYSGFRIKYPPGSFPLRSALRRRRTGSHPLHSLPDRWRETDRRWRPPAARRCGRAGWAR